MLIGLMGAAIRSRSPAIIVPTGIVWQSGAANVTYSNGGLTVTKDAGATSARTINHTGNAYGPANIRLAVAVTPTQVGGGGDDVAYGFNDASHTLGFNGSAWYYDGNFFISGYPGFTKDGTKQHVLYLEISASGATKKFWSWYEGYGWADHTGDPTGGGGGIDISTQFSGSTTMKFFTNIAAAGDSNTANFGATAFPVTLPAGTVGFGN